MSVNILPSDRAPVMGFIDPQSLTAAATAVSTYIDMSKFENCLAVLSIGAMTATGVLNAKLRQATSSAGAGVKDITSKAMTQRTAAGGDGSQQVEINCRATDLDTAGGFNFVALSVTATTAASLISAVIHGFDACHEPETVPASVVEVVK